MRLTRRGELAVAFAAVLTAVFVLGWIPALIGSVV